MNAIPEPSARVRMAQMAETAALVRRASSLPAARLSLFAGTVVACLDPAVRRAVERALTEAEGVSGPRPERTEPPWAENWFCASCLSLCVGGRTPDSICGGCREARGAAA